MTDTGTAIEEVKAAKNALTAERVVSNVQKQVVTDDCITAKMNFRFKSGKEDLSVGGNLKMKKDDVIQLSLVALGLMEAARIEFTQEDVLVIDRIHKRYIKAAYDQFSFLKEAGIDFNALQSLFRNTIFLPGNQKSLTLENTTKENTTVSCQNNRLKFKFITDLTTNLVQQTQITSAGSSKAAFNWIYSDFTDFGGKQFPQGHQMLLTGVGQDTQVDIKLSKLSNNSDWETRTTVKKSYEQMQASDLLKMLKF